MLLSRSQLESSTKAIIKIDGGLWSTRVKDEIRQEVIQVI